MGSPDRIDRRRLLAAEPTLRQLDPELADELVGEVDLFLQAAAAHARSPSYGVRLREPLPHASLVTKLLASGDALRLADDPEGLGSWCVALAARLGVLLEDLDPERIRALVFVEEDGSLVLVPYDPDDVADIPGLDGEPEP